MSRALYFALRRWTTHRTRRMHTIGPLVRFVSSSCPKEPFGKNGTHSLTGVNTKFLRNSSGSQDKGEKINCGLARQTQRSSWCNFTKPNSKKRTFKRARETLTHSKSYPKRSNITKRVISSPQDQPVPSSFDITSIDKEMDVEKLFPSAMAHLKSVSGSTHVEQQREDKKWHDKTHVYNVDGYAFQQREAAYPSFFDQQSLDIRGGIRDATMRSTDTECVKPPLPSSLPSTNEEMLSPDILQLTGGQPREDGLALSQRSNLAPADQTIEGDDSENDFGDTPVQITDMLRERLMELKTEKLCEDREETFLPRRLHLPSDAEIRSRGAPENERKERVDLLSRDSKGASLFGSRVSHKQILTLSDLERSDRISGRELLGNSEASTISSPFRDGVGAEEQKQVARFLRQSNHYLPGSNTSSQVFDSKLFDNKSFGGDELSDSSKRGTQAVYLLRVLPRTSCCSRREASAIIATGQVRVNNVIERNPFRLILPEDDVHVVGHGSRLRYPPSRLWMYHKPANVLVSRSDVAGRALISKHARILGMDHLIPVGSLPLRAHGILMLTNDGELSRFLENPKSNIQQTYLFRVRPAIDPILAYKFNTEGINVNGMQYKNAEFLVNPAIKSRYSVKVKVRGETMHVSELMQCLGRKIERGGRISFGPFALSTLPVGSLREVTVPLFYAHHLGAVWKPFVERDWPYFRRQRVMRLRQLARYRELTPKEAEELEQYTYEEVHHALSFESSELSAAARKRTQILHQQTKSKTEQALEEVFTESASGKEFSPIDSEWTTGDGILDDITMVT